MNPEGGSIVAGALIALVLVGGLAVAKPFAWAEDVAGPPLFLLIALLLAASLLRVVQHSRKGSSG